MVVASYRTRSTFALSAPTLLHYLEDPGVLIARVTLFGMQSIANMSNSRVPEGGTGSPTVSIRQDHFMQRMDVEKINFRKLFRDVRMHVDVGMKLYQAKRTESDARFYDLFESLNLLLESVQKSQDVLSKGCPRYERTAQNLLSPLIFY